MSAQYLKVYLKPKSDDGLKSLKLFLKHVKDRNYDAVAEMDTNKDIDDPERSLDGMIKSKAANGTLFLEYDTYCSVDVEDLFRFFLSSGADRVEAEVYNSQVGEYSYYCNTDYAEDYYDLNWEFLPEPYDINISEKRIAILGNPGKKTAKAIKEAEEDYEAMIQDSVADDTNLVVGCEGAEASEIEKAEGLSIRVITEKHFLDLV